MDHVNDSDRFRSVFKFELRDPDASLTDAQFDDIHRQILIWSLNKTLPCSIMQSPTGFSVEVHHYLDLGDDYAASLNQHLAEGIFRDLEAKGLAFAFVSQTV